MRAENFANWLIELSNGDTQSSIDGLVLVKEFRALSLAPEQYLMMEKAESYAAHSVFFEAGRNNRAPVAQAFIYVSDHPGESHEFALLHKRLWSWGGRTAALPQDTGQSGIVPLCEQGRFRSEGYSA
ncbi:hypothetical protein [Methylobacterium sp. WL8]|uniref:hypothetical protein n=1 Tax=Methylobacterium sp. WL8 TaxID=2603899 RepID=UPI00164F4614|nr:hypothetical protein [Methylobacterium sp. WL8]